MSLPNIIDEYDKICQKSSVLLEKATNFENFPTFLQNIWEKSMKKKDNKISFKNNFLVIKNNNGNTLISFTEIALATMIFPYIKHLNKIRKQIMSYFSPTDDAEKLLKSKDDKVIKYINSDINLSNSEKKLLIKIVQDQQSWGGGKLISRQDFWQSSMYKSLNLVQSCSSLHIIIQAFLSDDSLYSNTKKILNIDTENSTIPIGVNELHYGAPGTGKSYSLNIKFSEKEKNGFLYRVTFYPDYDYSDFIGGLRPQTSKNITTYPFTPGPFTRALIKAINYPNEEVILLIEELNRANAASVFGDIFQLLDRKDDGSSCYTVYNEQLANYIQKQTKEHYYFKNNNIEIPSNLSIIATMNPTDQGTFVLDTAFKRRWKQIYHKINWNYDTNNEFPQCNVAGLDITWAKLGQNINSYLQKNNVDEDNQLGQFFMSIKELSSKEIVASKLLGYLWNDVLKYQRNVIFNTNSVKTLNDVIEKYKSGKIKDVFNNDFLEQLNLDKD